MLHGLTFCTQLCVSNGPAHIYLGLHQCFLIFNSFAYKEPASFVRLK